MLVIALYSIDSCSFFLYKNYFRILNHLMSQHLSLAIICLLLDSHIPTTGSFYFLFIYIITLFRVVFVQIFLQFCYFLYYLFYLYFSVLSDHKCLSMNGLYSSGESLPALTTEAYERRLQKLEQEKIELARKFEGRKFSPRKKKKRKKGESSS